VNKKTTSTSHIPALAWAVTGLLALSPQHQAQAQVFVAQIADFHRHIELHRERVVQLGLCLAQAKFPDLTLADIESFLRLHDSSKTMTSPMSLQRYQYENEVSPVHRLFGFYGKPNDSEEERIQLKNTVSDINELDQRVANEFFSERPDLSHETVQKYFLIERIADVVDRSLDPVASEEFHQKLTPASQFFQSTDKVELSHWLEERYHMITEGLHMPTLQDLKKNA
jgi:hypothetical protein